MTAFAAPGQTAWHLLAAVGVLACSLPCSAQRSAGGERQDALPEVAELRARAVSSFKASETARERYICRERIRNDELNGSGQVKKSETLEREIFYVNGYEISQAVSRDGAPLSPAELRKRDEAVQKAIAAASAHRKPKPEGLVISAGDILRLARLSNERRTEVSGRTTIVFDVVPDPSARPSSIEEKLVAAMAGTVSIDEATGNLQDVNTRGVRDVKIGGGLVAQIHRGFAVHILSAPQPDGVWLLSLAEGAGDARVGLLVRSGVRFRQETEGCQLFDVSTTQSAGHPAGEPARESGAK